MLDGFLIYGESKRNPMRVLLEKWIEDRSHENRFWGLFRFKWLNHSSEVFGELLEPKYEVDFSRFSWDKIIYIADKDFRNRSRGKSNRIPRILSIEIIKMRHIGNLSNYLYLWLRII